MKKSTILLLSLCLVNLIAAAPLIYGGAFAVGMGAIIGIFIESSGFLLAIPGAAMIYAGIKSPNILKNYKAEDSWSYELILTYK